jgi:AcrR family transcriptional regulator
MEMVTGPKVRAASQSERLAPEHWVEAALAAIAAGGVASVSVERLAIGLGATKGSFYWHFKDRPALIDAALAEWEVRYTDRVIERLEGFDEPRVQFQQLLRSAFTDNIGVRIDATLLADATDPAVGAALERVAEKRLTFVKALFDHLGADDSADRALLAFSAYLGLAQLRRTAPALTPNSRRVKAYIDHATGWLLGD